MTIEEAVEFVVLTFLIPEGRGQTAETLAMNLNGFDVVAAGDVLASVALSGWMTVKSNRYVPTRIGQLKRMEMLRERGWLRKPLLDPSPFTLSDLILAIVMHGTIENKKPRSGGFLGADRSMSVQAVEVYLDHAGGNLLDAVDELLSIGWIKSARGRQRSSQTRFEPTPSGFAHYRDHVADALGLEMTESILEVRQANEITLFYAWQATVKKSRNQITDALDRIVALANRDWGVVRPLRVVLAANNEDGAIHIDSTLLERIEEADFFLADLTPNYAQGEVLCPNPNALFEAGYAMGTKSPSQVFLVVQLAQVEELKSEAHAQRFPFDIANVNQIQYKSPKDLRKKLTDQLKARLQARGWLRG